MPVDYDNDGWMVLFVSRMFGRGYQLLKNNGGGGFVDVTKFTDKPRDGIRWPFPGACRSYECHPDRNR